MPSSDIAVEASVKLATVRANAVYRNLGDAGTYHIVARLVDREDNATVAVVEEDVFFAEGDTKRLAIRFEGEDLPEPFRFAMSYRDHGPRHMLEAASL